MRSTTHYKASMSSNSVSRLQRRHIPSSSRARLRTSRRHDLRFGVNRWHGLLQECKEGCDSSRVMSRALAVLFVDKHAAEPPPTPGLSLRILFRNWLLAAFVLSQTILLGAWAPAPAYAFEVSISGRNESDTLENVPGELSRGEVWCRIPCMSPLQPLVNHPLGNNLFLHAFRKRDRSELKVFIGWSKRKGG